MHTNNCCVVVSQFEAKAQKNQHRDLDLRAMLIEDQSWDPQNPIQKRHDISPTQQLLSQMPTQQQQPFVPTQPQSQAGRLSSYLPPPNSSWTGEPNSGQIQQQVHSRNCDSPNCPCVYDSVSSNANSTYRQKKPSALPSFADFVQEANR